MLFMAGTAALIGCSGADDVGFGVKAAVEVAPDRAELGGSYDFHVVPTERDGDVTEENAKLVQFSVSPDQAFAAVMRQRNQGDLLPYLVLYPPARDAKLAVSHSYQSTLPMALDEDAAVFHQSSEEQEATFSVLAGDLHLDATASFQLDLIALDSDLPAGIDLTLSNPGVRAVRRVIWHEEERVSYFIEMGGFSEGDDGLLVEHPKNVDKLKERAEAGQLSTKVNGMRRRLFEEIARSNGFEDDPDVEAEIGAACGSLWQQLRSETHQLR